MQRVRKLVVFGELLTGIVLATLSAHSRAAAHPSERLSAAAVAPVSGVVRTGELLPMLAKHEMSPVFGSFIKPGASPSALPSGDSCPVDMVGVEGDYCPMVTQRCLRWLDPETKLQCAEFDRAASAAGCSIREQHKRFCIDRYEWPNKAGALPQYMASWNEAKASCERIGKRLCSDTEWTLACEGPERQPYPYGDGYVRSEQACNIDRPYIWPDPTRIYDRRTTDAELSRLDQREPSGSRPACVSPYGVRDMVGNVDEWVINESQGGKPFRSGLKGGYWGPVRTRCRPMTTAHDEGFRYYQIGFRCCGQAQEVDTGEMPLGTHEDPTLGRGATPS
jgi:formylglycine-generating enzyme